MAFRFNVFTGTLDISSSSGTGSGDVFGPAFATDRAIAIYDGITGKLIQNSIPTIQAGGAIKAQSFLTNRVVNELVTIDPNYTWLAANIELEDGEIIIDTNAELVIL